MSVEWQKKNPERYLAYLHDWCDRNRARTRMNSRIYYWTHREEILARRAEEKRATAFFQSMEMLSRVGKVAIPDAPPPDPEAEALARQERRRAYEHRRWLEIKADPERHRRLNARKLVSLRRRQANQHKSKENNNVIA